MKTIKKLLHAYAEKVRSVPNIEKQAKYNLILAIVGIIVMCCVPFITAHTVLRCVLIVLLCICCMDCTCSYAIQKEHIRNEKQKKT